MTKLRLAAVALAVSLLAGCVQPAPPPQPPRPEWPKMGGAEMYPDRSIVENLMGSRDHTKLVAAIKRAEMTDTLTGPGPITLFAPTDAAFDRLPVEITDRLARSENRAQLARLLGYHVLLGTKSTIEIAADIDAGGGSARYETQSGGPLQISRQGSGFAITDAAGGRSFISQADVPQGNGLLHEIDAVLMPLAQ